MTHNSCASPGRRRHPRRALVWCCAALVVILLACTSSEGEGAGEPTGTTLVEAPTVSMPEGFVLADTRGVAVAPFRGRSASAQEDQEVRGGQATIAGIVTGPAGEPVAGATVQLERFVGDRIGRLSVTTGTDGRYRVGDAQGGRYRVRAWLQPSLSTTEPRVEFLAHDARAESVDFALQSFDGHLLAMSFDRGAWNVGEVGLVKAVLGRQAVDEAGIVVMQGVPAAQVRLDVSGAASIAVGSGNPVVTDGSGTASWRVECTREGGSRVAGGSQLASADIELPSCGPRSQATTTTTIVVPAFPVGDTFSVPFGGPVPPGVYQTFLAGCETTYEELVGGSWVPRSSVGDAIQLGGPGRAFQPGSGTGGCSYQRVS